MYRDFSRIRLENYFAILRGINGGNTNCSCALYGIDNLIGELDNKPYLLCESCCLKRWINDNNLRIEGVKNKKKSLPQAVYATDVIFSLAHHLEHRFESHFELPYCARCFIIFLKNLKTSDPKFMTNKALADLFKTYKYNMKGSCDEVESINKKL